MNLERRTLPVNRCALQLVKRAMEGDGAGNGEGDAPLPDIAGYAAVFYQNDEPTTQYMLYDDLAERIMPGCFDEAIREDDVRALFNHNVDLLLGRSTAGTCLLSVDRTGLGYRITPNAEVSVSRDVVGHLRRGDLSGSSFSFVPTDVSWREQDGLIIREINKCRLFDVGPVTFPAYEATTSGLRSADSHRSAELAAVRQEMEAWKAGRSIDVNVRIAHCRRIARLRELGL